MLFSNLRRVRPPAPREPPRSAVVQDRAAAASYPPAAPGIPACAIEEILASHEGLILRIKLAYGADRETFERDLLCLIRRYAACVHLLPATPDNYFSAPGGAFRMGLEVAFHALQATDGHIFSGRSTIAVRSEIEPRWRHASFIAGLCCELHRTLGHLLVTDATGEQWPAYLMPLHTWLAARKAQRYCVKWLPEAVETRSLGVFALPHIVPAEILQHLAHDNALVVPHLMASISGMALHRAAAMSWITSSGARPPWSSTGISSPARSARANPSSALISRTCCSMPCAGWWPMIPRGGPTPRSRASGFAADGLFIRGPGPPPTSSGSWRPTSCAACRRRRKPCWRSWWRRASSSQGARR